MNKILLMTVIASILLAACNKSETNSSNSELINKSNGANSPVQSTPVASVGSNESNQKDLDSVSQVQINSSNGLDKKIDEIPANLHGKWALSIDGACSEEYDNNQGQYLYIKSKKISMDENYDQCSLVKIIQLADGGFQVQQKCSAEGYEDWTLSEKWIGNSPNSLTVISDEGNTKWIRCAN